jgi:hypothetical protein
MVVGTPCDIVFKTFLDERCDEEVHLCVVLLMRVHVEQARPKKKKKLKIIFVILLDHLPLAVCFLPIHLFRPLLYKVSTFGHLRTLDSC